MKQRITSEQLNELTQKQKDRLREWWLPQNGDAYYYPKINSTGNVPNGYRGWEMDDMKKRVYPLLSIGQMIEILRNRNEFTIDTHRDLFGVSWKEEDETYISWDKVELCDALWGAVKHSLGEVKE